MNQNDERRTTNDDAVIRDFTDLKAWQEARKLVVIIYEMTQAFPKSEDFGLTSQMKRAVISITSNIAEGFKRDTMRDKVHFYVMAHGSLSEIQNHMYAALDVGYIAKDKFDLAYVHTVDVDRLLTGLIRASKARLR